MTLLLVRHATHTGAPGVLWGRTPGLGLSAEGREEASALARALRPRALAALYTSPRRRCRETAAAIAEEAGLEAVDEPALDEIDYGTWTGRAFAELEDDADWRLWNAERSRAAPPGGESMRAAQARALGVLPSWLARHGGRTVAAVTHADVIRALACAALALSLDRVLRFDADLASVTTLALWRGGPPDEFALGVAGKITRLNEVFARDGAPARGLAS